MIIEKISYDRRDYESVDEKSLSKAMFLKTTKKKNSGSNGLRLMLREKVCNKHLNIAIFFTHIWIPLDG